MGPEHDHGPAKQPAGRANDRRSAVEPTAMMRAKFAGATAAAFVEAPPSLAFPITRRVDAGRIAAVLGAQRRLGNRATARLLQRVSRPSAAGRHAPVVQRTPITVDAERVTAFLDAHKGYAKILAGFAERGTVDDKDLVTDLLDQFVHRGDFTYTGASVGSIDATDGDCSTLVRQFVALANEGFGLKMTESTRLAGPLFIKGGGQIIHSGPKTGNVDHGQHWRFDDHVWAIWNGAPIDVLFGIVGALKSAVKVAEDGDGVFVADGTTYYLANLPKMTETNRYTSVAADRLPAREKKAVEAKEEKPALTLEEKLAKAARDLDDLYESFIDEETMRQQTVDRVMEDVKRRDDIWSGDFLDPTFKTGSLKLFCNGQRMMDFEFNREKWEAWIKS